MYDCDFVMPDRHTRFIHVENMRQFRRKLETETDPDKRKLLEQLLSEEEANKLPHPKPQVTDDP